MSAELLIDHLLERARLPRKGVRCQAISLGKSGDSVLRLTGPLDAVVKLARRDRPENLAELDHEIAALRWLNGRARVPGILWAGDVEDRRALVSETLPGTPVSDVTADEAPAAMAAMIAALATLHTVDTTDCPFDQRLAVKLAEAERRARAGLVDLDDLDEGHRGLDGPALIQRLRDRRPTDEDLAPAHGDACLPNAIWSRDAGVGFVDLGRFGVADRWQDLALFLRSAASNHPHVDAGALLLAGYPLPAIDADKTYYYRLLDECF